MKGTCILLCREIFHGTSAHPFVIRLSAFALCVSVRNCVCWHLNCVSMPLYKLSSFLGGLHVSVCSVHLAWCGCLVYSSMSVVFYKYYICTYIYIVLFVRCRQDLVVISLLPLCTKIFPNISIYGAHASKRSQTLIICVICPILNGLLIVPLSVG